MKPEELLYEKMMETLIRRKLETLDLIFEMEGWD